MPKCESGCLKHKYHCAKCNAIITYSPANYASRPNDIPNPCPNDCGRIAPASTEEWEKEFDERFMSAPPFNYEKMPDRMGWYSTGLAIKSFIRSHDQQLRQRIVEVGDKLKQDDGGGLYEYQDAFNEGISSYQQLIKNL